MINFLVFYSNIYKTKILNAIMAKEEGDNSFGVASLIFGLLSLVLIFTLTGFVAAIICGIFAIIFGLVQKKRENSAWATWGIILGLIGILVNLFIIWKIIIAINQTIEQLKQLQQSGALNALGQGAGALSGAGA